MARKRMIDPSFWTDEKLGECSIQERLLFMGLISNADDDGYGRANPKLLKSLIFPYDDLRASDLEKWLSHLGGWNIVVLYEYNGQTYYNLPNFLKHQTINKPTPTNFPTLDTEGVRILTEYYGSTTVVLPPNRKEENRKEIEENRREKKVDKPQKFIKPSVSEIEQYCKERNNSINPERFYDYYEANGWKIGKNTMKDWKAAVRTWEKNNFNIPNSKTQYKITDNNYTNFGDLSQFYDNMGDNNVK